MEKDDIFFALIRLGLHIDGHISVPYMDDALWAELFSMAQKQALTGVMMEAVNRLPEEVDRPNGNLKIKLMKMALNAEKFNMRADLEAIRWTEFFARKGYRSMLLKGQGLAMLYPNPRMRMPGDTDLWVMGDGKCIRQLCRDELGAKEFTYHHIGIDGGNGMELEVHSTPSWMYSYTKNRRLQGLFAQWADDAREIILSDAGKVYVPSDEMNRVFMLVHMFRHVFSEGIGLRQMADYAMLLKRGCTEKEREVFCRQVKELNLYGFAGAVMYVMEKVFGLDRMYLLTEPDGKRGKKLLEGIMKGGNFGKYDKSIYRTVKYDSAMSFLKRNIRNLRLLKEYPEEVVWGPAFKIWHWAWRRMVMAFRR